MTKKIKVLIVTNLFPNNREPNRGIFVKQEVLELSKLCDLQVIAPVPWAPFTGKPNTHIVNTEEIEGITTYHPRRLVIPKVLRSLYAFLFFISIFPALKRIKKSFDFEVIYALWIYPDGVASVAFAKFFKVPVFLHALGCDINQYTKFFLRKAQITWGLRNADGIFSVSNALKNKMLQLGIPSEKIDVIPNGIDAEKFRPMDQGHCRKTLHIPPDLKCILFIGSLETVKGAEYLIEAFHQVQKKYPDPVHLFIIGKGVLENTMKKKISAYGLESRVTLVGAVKHDRIPLWLNASDIFCLPSIREGMPNVILEALSCGKPVVASRVGGIPELITKTDYGILFPPNDTHALAASLVSALEKNWDSGIIYRHFSTRSWKVIAEEIQDKFQKTSRV